MGKMLQFKRGGGESRSTDATRSKTAGTGQSPIVEQIARMRGLSADAEAYMTRVLNMHFDGRLSENQAFAEIARAKAISDVLEMLCTILGNSRIGSHPELRDFSVSLGTNFADKVRKGNLLPEWEHVPAYDHIADVERTWDMYNDAMRPLAQHMDSLVDLGLSIKDYPKIVQDAHQIIRLAAGMRGAGGPQDGNG